MLPILYSFRRCPYAIRARLAILQSGLSLELREVVLRNKPESMLAYSVKGTVPVVVLVDGTVIDESWDVMKWALSIYDPDQWLSIDSEELVVENDRVFKKYLDRYKYAERFPEKPAEYYRAQAEVFLQKLEVLLEKRAFLSSEKISLIDIAIFPFIRQFAFVDKDWFDQSPYPHLKSWLEYFLSSELFKGVMKKYPAWEEGDSVTLFPKNKC